MERKPFETTCDGIALRGEMFFPDKPSRITMIPLCHGIPREQTRQGDPGYFPLAERLTSEGFGALIFNFRGCGISDGDFDLVGWGRDVIAVVKALKIIPSIEKIVPWGFSGGAAATAYAAARETAIDAAALFACPADFTALRAVPVASGLVEYFRRVGIIRDSDFPKDAEEWLRNFADIDPVRHAAMMAPRPLLIVHGSNDETVPLDHARKLFDAAKEPKTLRIIEGAQHRLRESAEAIEAAFKWLKEEG